MVLHTARRVVRTLRGPRNKTIVPYDMFDALRSDKEVRAARKMEGIYHKGQDKAWNGKELLEELVQKHGGVDLPPEKIEPLQRMFAVIFWGELAAWKVSAELALEIEPLEAKMAASSQAHDEARHFYVMHDYLSLIGYQPEQLPTAGNRILNEILQADSLAKKLVGMQLMVEPIALTLFQLVREGKVEPVLCELLSYYERDEARHIALGVNYLPQLIQKMSPGELVDFYIWQIRMFMIELDGVREMEEDFHALGIDPRKAIRIGQTKQLHAGRLVMQQMNIVIPVEEILTRAIEARMAIDWPLAGEPTGRVHRWNKALQAVLHNAPGTRKVQQTLDEMIARGMGSGASAA